MTHTDDFSNAFIARVAGLLDEFHTGDRLTLSELSTRTGLPRSSTHRLLTQLAEHGWVSKRGKTYALGRTPLEWGALARNHDRLHRAAHPVLHDLHSATGLVVHLAVLEGGDVRYVDKVGRGPVALPSRIGGRQPAHRTALGKALLAHTRMHAAYPATGCTYATAPRAENLLSRNEIARIRERHVAHECGESLPGIACVAAPIGNGQMCVGALSVTGPVDIVDTVSLATPVRLAARAVWRSLSPADSQPHLGRPMAQRTSA
ncbi:MULTISPECIES: IclR family transcriptional regulator [Rhodococcus]|uniref:IclR family transcriptional regulator n=1 Tax=Rhodococcus rhodochrous TaxID=1829 RepID=A0AAW4XPV5_RHORH|nr:MULTISPECIES: IclR family transcriptional regulator [Rhodococcus]MCD2114819.1 IclR family transcriptional regulator [Rhodococcus rhodochrous]MXQ75131.1 helix-turn-helix domain-containing protein [Rhodococcus rhodochrous]OWY81653.1 IclR family transcriptional regulator [Rhodococcus sp. BUPNP1]QHG82204.1 IclR family transcriptional regulator [Rhodococcus rhodochrous]QOH58122.1 IclR family transcriptional regulator [Rhodococcus rhodochrous]